jgi:LPS O-antigen subunit length determinant protein (WzzB/FepE family)
LKDESLETGMSQRSKRQRSEIRGQRDRKMEELEAALQQFAEIGTDLKRR